MEERLQKILSRSGFGSRRACEELIVMGRVTVNGEMAELGSKADPKKDTIRVDDAVLQYSEPEKVYIMLNKPRFVLSDRDPSDPRRSVFSIVENSDGLFVVGRLDFESEGLILLTNDGELANKLSHPRYGKEKEYQVLVAKRPDDKQLKAWRHGVVLEDGEKTGPAHVQVSGLSGKGAWLRVVMTEGRKRQIREIGKTIGEFFTRKLDTKHVSDDRHMLYMMFISCIPLLFLFIPVGGGQNLKDLVEGLANDTDILVEGFCFLITAILLFTGSRASRTKKNIRPMVEGKDAWWVGVAQLAAAAFPGISRSGSTISTGMLRGVDKDYMVEYSFVLGTPAVLAAAVLEIKDTLEGGALALGIGPILVGIVVSAVVGVAAIKLLEWLVNKDKFQFFGYYCLILSAVVITLATLEKLGIL